MTIIIIVIIIIVVVENVSMLQSLLYLFFIEKRESICNCLILILSANQMCIIIIAIQCHTFNKTQS